MIRDVAANMQQSLSDAVGQRVRQTFELLEARYGGELPEVKRDMLLANCIYGLTSVIHANDAPEDHLAAIRSYLEQIIPAERAAKALKATPASDDSWLVSVLERIEAIGKKHGHALLAQGASGKAIPFINRDVSAAGSAEPAAVKGNAVEEALTR
ncbi:hypothetical protein ATN84_22275 [Paramesorhizobium deserti]|uniref:Uncharacterized protein n=1 Tax=Paramesorhizobium deserti TaxID=1494590 RepID=A0A135HPB6_9HYPH|nr:hypothetical protein [Paramesorhizobium deserti]KXF74943.1 hypothetical protein ATN84_22275 [Paramesorhizobium deserti]